MTEVEVHIRAVSTIEIKTRTTPFLTTDRSRGDGDGLICMVVEEEGCIRSFIGMG